MRKNNDFLNYTRLCEPILNERAVALMEKFGLSSAGLWKILSTFERENPQEAALMKRQGKEMTPEDYKELQRELSRLKKELERERLRADFYEEMVAYGEEVYGIKLKKAGTK